MGENPAALRAAGFSLSSINLRGAFNPPAGRGLKVGCHMYKNKHLPSLFRFTIFYSLAYQNDNPYLPRKFISESLSTLLNISQSLIKWAEREASAVCACSCKNDKKRYS